MTTTETKAASGPGKISPGRAACEAFWAAVGAGPDTQEPTAAWDWAFSQNTTRAWEAAAKAAAGAASPVAAALDRAEATRSHEDTRGLPGVTSPAPASRGPGAAVVAAPEGGWRERAEAAEARLARIATHCRERLNAPGRSGMSRTAAGIILGLAEGGSEGKAVADRPCGCTNPDCTGSPCGEGWR